MKKLIVLGALLLGVSQIATGMTYDEASKLDKPVVVMFKMSGCGACKEFEPFFDKTSAKYGNKFSFVKEHIGFSGSKLSNKLKISSVPSVFILEDKKNKKQTISYDCLTTNGCFEQKLKEY